MKVALAQINTTVGWIADNEQRILAAYKRGVEAGADVVVLPELAITGYPPRDLLLKHGFIDRNLSALERLAEATSKVGLIVGFVGRNEVRPGREATNSVALCQNGKVIATRVKTLLPTYDVFDEDRYFEPAKENHVVEFNGRKVALTVCEDIWNDEDFWHDRRYQRNPVNDLVAEGAEIIFNVSASPWHLGKNRTRHEMLKSMAVKSKRPLIYCNSVGGNDELVFDGGSLVFNAAGQRLAQGKLFDEDFLLVDLQGTDAGTAGLHP
jgi:NAD+ synthase (glutamine-hydrolysing)